MIAFVGWWALAAGCVWAAARFVDWMNRGQRRPDNVIKFAPYASRTGQPVPPGVPRGPRRRDGAA